MIYLAAVLVVAVLVAMARRRRAEQRPGERAAPAGTADDRVGADPTGGREQRRPRPGGRRDGHGLGLEPERARLLDGLRRRLVGLPPDLGEEVLRDQ